MYCLLKTNHSINQYVMECVERGFNALNPYKDPIKVIKPSEFKGFYTPVSYGILRGNTEVFTSQKKAERDYWEIDLGYFNSGHFSGYYRISKNGTRAKYNPDIADTLSEDRWLQLGINISPWKIGGEYILYCPPTEPVRIFYGLTDFWEKKLLATLRLSGLPIKIREKNALANVELKIDLQDAACVVAFNSNVMIEALIAGVPVVGFSEDIMNWNKFKPKDIGKKDLTECDRLSLFKFLSYCQFTLPEFSTGQAWQITQEVQNA